MALSDIKKKIETEAREEANRILAKASQDITQVNAEAEKSVRDTNALYNERFNKEKPEILRRREIVANLDVARIQLGAKQSLIGKAFDEALSILCSMPQDRYLGFAYKLLQKAVKTGKEVVYIGKNESKINADWINNYNSQNNTALTLAGERLPISGGFVLRNERIDTNCSFDMLVRWIREDIESDVVKQLFGGEARAEN